MEFKVGDIVMIKGKITADRAIPNLHYPLEFTSDSGLILFFNREGKYDVKTSLHPSLELIERPKKKVIKYKVLIDIANTITISHYYYTSKENFEQKHPDLKFMQLLESTAKEFEE